MEILVDFVFGALNRPQSHKIQMVYDCLWNLTAITKCFTRFLVVQKYLELCVILPIGLKIQVQFRIEIVADWRSLDAKGKKNHVERDWILRQPSLKVSGIKADAGYTGSINYLFILLFIIRMRIKYSNIHVFPFMEEILKNHLPHYHTKDMLAWHNKKMVYKILGWEGMRIH